MYTANLNNLIERLFEQELPSYGYSKKHLSDFEYSVKALEDGKQELTLSVLGHNPKNIKLEATEDKISIKANKNEGDSDLIKNIDATFSVGKDYDGTKVDAKFINGLLILTIDKKEERKSKSISIKVG